MGKAYAKGSEVDPLGNDVGRSDPYAVDELADYGGSYSAGGNAFDESGGGCEWNQMPTDCRLLDFIARTQDVVRVARRTQGHEGGGFALSLSYQRWQFDVYQWGESGKTPEGDSEDETVRVNSQNLHYYGTIFASHLSVGSLGFSQPQSQRPYVSVYFFREGDHANFSKSEIGILDDVLHRIVQSDCEEWINGQLQGAPKDRNSLEKLLKIARFNKYDTKLNASNMGISESQRQDIRQKYDDRFNWLGQPSGQIALAVTTNQRDVYLMTEVFERSKYLGVNRDTAGRIVHELFHIAWGDNDHQRITPDFDKQISAHCGLPRTKF